jgi:putative ABC transport system permease protein
MTGPIAPPRLAVALLERCLPAEVREAFVGDLHECFHQVIVPARGLRRARYWYWREALRAPFTLTQRAAAPAPLPPGDHPMRRLLFDLRYAVRLLGRAPGFTALVTLTLALGIGATTAIFSAVYPTLFAPLPYPDPDRIVLVWEREQDGARSNMGWETFHDLTEQSRSFAALTALGTWQPVISGGTAPDRLEGQRVSPGFLRVLGVPPALGRDFIPEDDARDAERVTILSHALWQSRFGGDSSLVGRGIMLDGVRFTVIGVMPAGFENVLEPRAQLYTPLRYDATLAWACRSCRHLRVAGRLRAGVSPDAAEHELAALSHRMVMDHPTDYPAEGMLVPTLHEEVASGVRPALLAVLGAVGLLLLIACANVTNLLLARAAEREGEFSLRTALGAARGRVVGQLLTEGAVLVALGALAGIVVAIAAVRGIVALSPAQLPRLGAIHVGGPILLFTLAVTCIVALAVGLVPALHAARGDLHDALKRGSSRSVARRHLTRGVLVVSEVGLALTLLVGSGLLLRSMSRLLAVSPGFDPAGLLTLQVQAAGPRFENDTVTRAYFDQVLQAVRAVPGVEQAAFTNQLPLSNDFDAFGVHSESHPSANPADDPSAHRYAVSAGYLETMRIPLLRGRPIEDRDRAGAPLVALVSQAFARRFWKDEDPIGQRIRMGGNDGPWRTIIGITGDVKQVSLSAEQPNGVYLPESQWLWADNALTIVVRTRGAPEALVPAVRSAIWSVDRDQPIVRIARMDRLVAATAAQRRFIMVLFEAFAAVALVLAAAGIYGVLSGSVTERFREIGVRSALGASRAQIVGMILRQGIVLTAIGVGVGLAAAVGLTGVLRTLLFDVSRLDVVTFATVTAGLFVVALAACLLPAWRAARVDPMETLRAE